jgi:hypothetical protein
MGVPARATGDLATGRVEEIFFLIFFFDFLECSFLATPSEKADDFFFASSYKWGMNKMSWRKQLIGNESNRRKRTYLKEEEM